jgi:hypothetical protein
MAPENCCYPKDVTTEWLTDVLVHAGHRAKVRAFDMINIGTGQVGQNIRFTLDYSEGQGPASVVIKFASDDPVSRQTGIAVNDYLKEVLFYQQLNPGLDITTPDILFSAINLSQPDQFVLVMEDLAPAQQGDQLAGCSADEASLALGELAGLSGPRWCDATLRKLDWLVPPDRKQASPSALWDMTLPGFLQRYENRMSSEHIDLARRLGDHFLAYNKPVTDAFTLVHIDYRLDNMMFGGPYPLAVVDWSPSIGTGAADAAYFMGTGLEAPERAKCEVRVLQEYHQRLVSYGVGNYDFDTCWLDYRHNSFAGLVMAVIASMIVAQTDRGDDMFMTMARRSADMALELDALKTLT